MEADSREMRNRISTYAGQRICRLFFALLMLLSFLSMPVRADSIDLDVTYGYQNTAKAGRFLPLTIGITNNME